MDRKTIWSIGGGKGGIGKSITAVNLGVALAMRNRKVILVDADLGGANLHTYFGIKYPERGLEDFIRGRFKSLQDVAIPTDVDGLSLISGASEFVGIANPHYQQKQRLINHIRRLTADNIIVDLGAGTSYNVLDFFSISDEGIIVLVPEPAAIQNAYIFLKSFVYRRLERTFADNPDIARLIKESTVAKGRERANTFPDLCERIARVDRGVAQKALSEIKRYSPKLILNMAVSEGDLRAVELFVNASKTFLSMDVEFVGALYSNREIKNSARRMKPFMIDDSAVNARRDMDTIVSNLLREKEKKEAQEVTTYQPVFGYNDNISHRGNIFHVQTEVLGGDDPVVETVIYYGGRIFFSKKSRLKELNAQYNLKELATKQHRAAIAAIKMDRLVLEDPGR